MDNDRIRADCPNGHGPLCYDEQKDILFCKYCGYSEKVKNNVTINNIVTNNTIQTTQSNKSSAEENDDYRYVKAVEKAFRYVEQDDPESIGEVREELRRDFPSSYFYSILFAFKDKDISKIVLNPIGYIDFIKGEEANFVKYMNTPLHENNPGGIKILNYDTLLISYELVKDSFGFITDNMKEYLVNGEESEPYVVSILAFFKKLSVDINECLREKITKCIKYDIDKKHHEAILSLKKDCDAFVSRLDALYKAESKYAFDKLPYVMEVADMKNGLDSQELDKLVSTGKTSGFFATIIGLIIFAIGVLVTIIGIVLPDPAIGNGISFIGCGIALATLPFNIVGRKRFEGSKSKLEVICAIASAIAGFSVMVASASSQGDVRWPWVFPLFIQAIPSFISLIKLPKIIKKHKQIKENKAKYNLGMSQAEESLNDSYDNAEYEEIFDLAADFTYSFSSWDC
ncbi:MAG TPA: hypothetical protein DEF61_04765 [Firmicutes bacterium]|nr:hypothetical protein [Bacillota bacterium]